MLYFCANLEEFNSLKAKLKHKKLGFVPTMGNLHDGHASLIKRSIVENDLTVVSIFVNPTQFGEGEDFDTYPRTLEEDLLKIEKSIQGNPSEDYQVIVFAPKTEEEIYPKGFSDKVKSGKTGKILEGAIRPEHFDGVATVVKRFFTMFRPDVAYFGKKDYQQFVVIKQLVKEEGLKVKIIGLPTIREKSGLALSSRNGYLSSSEKEQGLKLRNTLLSVQEMLKSKKDLAAAQEFIKEELKSDPSFNYLVIKNADTLEDPLDVSSPLVILGNYQVNKVRLLDNLEVKL